MITVNYSNGKLSEAHDIGPEVFAESGHEDLVSIICKETYTGTVDCMKDMVCDFLNSRMKGWGTFTAHDNAFLGSKEPDHDERYVCMLTFSVDKKMDLQRTIYSSSVLADLVYCRYPWLDVDSENKRYADAIDAVKWLREAHGIDIVFSKHDNGEMQWETTCLDEKQQEYKTYGTSKAECAVEEAIASVAAKFKQLDV